MQGIAVGYNSRLLHSTTGCVNPVERDPDRYGPGLWGMAQQREESGAAGALDAHIYHCGLGRLIQKRSEAGNGDWVVYAAEKDALGRVVKGFLPRMATTSTYDGLGWVTVVTNTDGTRAFLLPGVQGRFDRRGGPPDDLRERRLVAVTVTEGLAASVSWFMYDRDGNLEKKIYADGTVVVCAGRYYEYELPSGGGPVATSYYFHAGRCVAMRSGGTLYYLYGDHLGSTSLTTNSSGGELGRQSYHPYGTVRWSSGDLQTDFTFTGQRSDGSTQLIQMGARRYNGRIGRWVSADTIVPNPPNPQGLNRFAYVYNNPLRYRDPTGHLSEDQIMSHFGVDTWDEVLAFFEQCRALEGRWGWLRTFREARIGDEIQIFEQYAGFWPPPGPAPARLALSGILANDQGQLQLSSAESVYALSEAATMGNASGVVRQNPAGMPPNYLGPYQNHRIYYETVVGIDPSRCDRAGAALDIGGLLLDTITLGQGSRATNLAKVARGLKKLVDVVSISPGWPPVAISLTTGDLAPGDGVGFVLEIAGVVSPVPFIPDILSLGANLSEAVTVERRP